MKFSKKLLIALSLFIFASVKADYESEITKAKGEGEGTTIQEAVINAKLDAISSMAEFFSSSKQMVNDELSEEIVFLSTGAVSDYEIISSFEKDGRFKVIIDANLVRDSLQLLETFGIDENKAKLSINGSLFASENAKWFKNQKDEKKFISHLLEKIELISNLEGLVISDKSKLGKMVPKPTEGQVGFFSVKSSVDYYASKNMSVVYDVVRKTLQSISVKGDEYTLEWNVYEVELCTDAMLFGDRFEKQKKKKKWGNRIPDCIYETYYLRNSESIQLLQTIEDIVRSEIKAKNIIRKYDNGSCKVVPYDKFDASKHNGIKYINNKKRIEDCPGNVLVEKLQRVGLEQMPETWPELANWKRNIKENFSNNLTFNTCNVAYKGKERIFFPITRVCRSNIPTCVITASYRNQNSAAFGLNLPLGGELIARKEITDYLKETEMLNLVNYDVQKSNDRCN